MNLFCTPILQKSIASLQRRKADIEYQEEV